MAETKDEIKMAEWKAPFFKPSNGKWYSREDEKLIRNGTFGKNIIFTYFGESKPKWKPDILNYLCFQREICPETKRLHWQGYAEFKVNTRLYNIWSTLEIGGAYCVNRKAPNGQDCRAYCSKAESGIAGTFEEFGQIQANGKGYRTDLAKVTRDIAEGKTEREIAILYPEAVVKYSRGLKEYRNLVTQEMKVPMPRVTLKEWQLYVIERIKAFEPFECRRKGFWIWSQLSGTGKTTTIRILQSMFGLEKIGIGDFRWDDMIYAYKNEQVLCFNIPREHDINDTHRAVLERTTDGGIVLSRKYESKRKNLDALVIVFANRACPHDKLPDRFTEICLDPQELIEERKMKARLEEALDRS